MMKNNVLAKKILCGLLAASVLGVAGSAMAADYTGKIGTGVYNDDVFNLTNNNIPYEIDVTTGNPVTINSRIININATADSNVSLIGADVWSGDKLTLGNDKTEKINVLLKHNGDSIARSKQVIGIYSAGANSVIDITTKELLVDVQAPEDHVNTIGIEVNNSTQSGTAPSNAAKFNIKAENISISSTNVGIAAFSNGQLKIDGNLIVNAKEAFEVRGNATVNVNQDNDNNTTVLNGDINFGTPNEQGGDSHDSGNIIDATLNINFNGESSVWNGKAYQELGTGTSIEINTSRDYYGDAKGLNVTFADGATWNMTGDSFVNTATVKDGAAINVQEDVKGFNAENIALNKGNLNIQGENTEENEQKITITNLTSNGGTINMQGSEQNINVINDFVSDNTTMNLQGEGQYINLENMSGSGAIVKTNSLDNGVFISEKADGTKIAVQGSSAITDQIASGEATLQDLANAVGNKEEESEISLADTVTSDANDIIGGYSAEVGKDGKIIAGSERTYENTTNRAISDMASISLMTWRQENNDMNKRLGELRDSKGEHGAWARMARGESKYGAQNVKNQYNYYQVGYDEKLSVDPNWTVGVALTRTEGNSTFVAGSGENKHTGVAVYGSYLNDNGSFIDLIAKYARMDNDFKTNGGVGNGDYETNGYSISAEYGKRFTKDNGFWIEPQVELTYGTVGSANYTTSKGAQVYQESIDSLVGRLGFSLGKNIKQGNVYVRASYLYDFDGETKAVMSKTGAGSASFEQDLGGGWWEVGVGTNINLSDATHLYFDVEKTYGGNVATPWQWNAGVRWSF